MTTDTPETDCHIDLMCINENLPGGIPMVHADFARDLERWIRQAAPMLSTATCIVIDENIDRLSEIEGVRAVLEMCPIDFTDNAGRQLSEAEE